MLANAVLKTHFLFALRREAVLTLGSRSGLIGAV